jgi:Na+-driven multidrug efflux pump
MGHLVSMAAFIGISQLFQTLYFIVDLYFVSRLGNAAVAGVSAAGNVFFVALAASQMISIGVLALVAQAVGKKDEAEANLFSDQALSMSVLFGASMLVLGYAFGGAWVSALAADPATAAQGRAFLYGFLPSLGLLFPTMALVSSLRGAGVVREVMVLQTATVLVNVVLAPVLIVGWGTGVALGTAGRDWQARSPLAQASWRWCSCFRASRAICVCTGAHCGHASRHGNGSPSLASRPRLSS